MGVDEIRLGEEAEVVVPAIPETNLETSRADRKSTHSKFIFHRPDLPVTL
jgi:hypothetical protein